MISRDIKSNKTRFHIASKSKKWGHRCAPSSRGIVAIELRPQLGDFPLALSLQEPLGRQLVALSVIEI
jgi:hypothetical protein